MFKKMNERVKRLTAVDIGLIKWSVILFTIIVVKLFPQLLKISYPVLILFVLVFGARPFYRFWIKK
ncbi:MAG: hypothetical protein PHW98_06910 [Candidatus Omnitrophica bacterium]|nr:hypothetical protein [Candidatus Omnitrophota bacterium]MDD5771774.1 hypothetical protein [Candidatus Omnitrophota bacterium]